MPPKTSVASLPKAPATSSKSSKKTPERKSISKQPLTIAERLKRLFTSLCAQVDGGHFSNAIKTCDKILRLDSADKDALQTKLFLLLQTEQYNAALSLIRELKEPDHYAFEQAYSLYRLQHEAEANAILGDIKEKTGGDRGVLHLEAQLNYRQGSYETAFDIYNQLLDTAEPQSEEHSDIHVNLQASQRHLDFMDKGFLRALDALPTSVTANLESAPPPSQPSSGVAAALASSSANIIAELDPGKKAVSKVRMSRLPKGVILGVTPPPDPERWLKKSERSTFGQGKRRRGGAGGGATQGSTVESVSATNASKSTGIKSKKKK